jgi:hypothetical protein
LATELHVEQTVLSTLLGERRQGCRPDVRPGSEQSLIQWPDLAGPWRGAFGRQPGTELTQHREQQDDGSGYQQQDHAEEDFQGQLLIGMSRDGG